MNEDRKRSGAARMGVTLRRRFGGRRRRMGASLRRALIAGTLLLVPVALTYLVLQFLFDVVDGVLQPSAEWLFVKLGLDWTVPGLGFGVAVALIYLAGFLIATTVGQRLISWGQGALRRIPLIGTVYSASRKLVESFSGSGNTGFKRVVMLQYPREGYWSIGFLTALTSTGDGKRFAVVYIPTAPLPNSGWVAVVALEEVLDTDMTVQDAMQVVFSGGIVSPAVINTTRLVEEPEVVADLASK